MSLPLSPAHLSPPEAHHPVTVFIPKHIHKNSKDHNTPFSNSNDSNNQNHSPQQEVWIEGWQWTAEMRASLSHTLESNRTPQPNTHNNNKTTKTKKKTPSSDSMKKIKTTCHKR